MSKCKRCAEHRKLKAELDEAYGTIHYVTEMRNEAWHRQDAAVADRDALKAEIGAAWEAAPDGYETDSLESLVKALAFVAEGESEIQQADPPQPYIDGALAWLASIEDELDTMDNGQLWGRFFGWMEAQR